MLKLQFTCSLIYGQIEVLTIVNIMEPWSFDYNLAILLRLALPSSHSKNKETSLMYIPVRGQNDIPQGNAPEIILWDLVP